MRRSHLRAMLVLLCLLTLTTAARAVILYDQKTLRRTDGQTALSTRLRFMVEDEGGYSRFLYVDVRYRIAGSVALQPGQSETFRVTGQVITGGTGTVHHVLVRVQPVATQYGYPTRSKVVVVVGPMTGLADFSVQPTGGRSQRRHRLYDALYRDGRRRAR